MKERFIKPPIGIVGQGFVGFAINEGMKHACSIYAYDKYKKEKSNVGSMTKLLEESRIVFVCVPTPMFPSGQCDTSIVEGVVKDIVDIHNNLFTSSDPNTIVVIKSTVPPGITEYLNSLNKDVDVIFSPEFLTEATFIEDFKNQNRVVLGGEKEPTNRVKRIFKHAYPHVPVLCCESKMAEMVKYISNCFLATKVSFANEIYQICNKLNINYDATLKIAQYDDRLGKSHWQVPGPTPGPNGKPLLGYSGSCFPKDINSLIYVSKLLGVKPTMLEACWEKNLEVRPERDWEKLVGRAVVK